MERHRLLWLWMRDQAILTEPGLRVLHIAPEQVLRDLLRAVPGVRYTGGDLESRLADVHFDVTAIPFGDASYDLVLCNHVLEHVPDDEQAMRELRRVLAPEGRAILMCPIGRDRAESYEDPDVRTPEQRLERFGQEDHARLYGADYEERLRRSGFALERIDLLASLDEATIARHGLRQNHPIFEDDVIYVGSTTSSRSQGKPSSASTGIAPSSASR